MLGERSSGVLLHVTSLPGAFGIGDLGPAAWEWVERLAGAKQRWWQVLPTGPMGAADSPYQCFSAFAGSPLLISPQRLAEDGLLTPADVKAARLPGGAVNYSRVARTKHRWLTIAYETFAGRSRHRLGGAFDAFQNEQADWLADYALFAALQEAHGTADWTRWPGGLAQRLPAALASAKREHADAVRRHAFWQFLFARQWKQLRDHARRHRVGLIGDLPIFVSAHSADVWANPHLFELDRRGRPTAVAGVPPDLFSPTGQRWGNPLYRWPRMKQDDFAWWRRRFAAALAQCDLVRLDHFRGFEAYWRVPAANPTAVGGRWTRGPGAALLNALNDEAGGLPVIAEDLGVITPAVERLRDDFDLPGMRILQFAFGGDGANPHLPHNFRPNCVVYTGTHDNDTTAGWHRHASAAERDYLRRYAPASAKPVHAMIQLAWQSVATLAIAPAQDLLNLDSRARMNTPGTDAGNWRWRLPDFRSLAKPFDWLATLTAQSNRAR